MKINSILNNGDLEKLYEKINDHTIFLPTKFKNLRLGLLPRICQLLITALKNEPHKKTKFYRFNLEEDNISDLLSDPQCLTALLMSTNVYDSNMTELKSKINKDFKKRLDESIYKRKYRVQLFAVDHSINKYAFPLCFYSPEGTTTLKQSHFYTQLLNKFIKLIPNYMPINSDELSNLGQIIYEIIENTEQHGKIELNTGKVNKSIRGLVIDYKLWTKNQSPESIGGENTPITNYLKSLRNGDDAIHLLEISIFDSGQGIFKSFESNSNYDLEKEVEIIKNSFAKGITSKADSYGYGRGLFNVRDLLNKRSGFISIRTGQLSLYRDFSKNSLVEKENEPLKLFDEISKSSSSYNKLKPVEGLAYSILVPIK